MAGSAGWLVDGEWPEGAGSTYPVVRLEGSAEGSQFEATAAGAALFPEETECSAPFSEVVCLSGANGVFFPAAYRAGCAACEPALRLTGGAGLGADSPRAAPLVKADFMSPWLAVGLENGGVVPFFDKDGPGVVEASSTTPDPSSLRRGAAFMAFEPALGGVAGLAQDAPADGAPALAGTSVSDFPAAFLRGATVGAPAASWRSSSRAKSAEVGSPRAAGAVLLVPEWLS